MVISMHQDVAENLLTENGICYEVPRLQLTRSLRDKLAE